MEQRRLRLGDILDDYCPRERRVTNHAIVAMIEEDIRQTRCTTCDAEHAYKGARVPTRRRKETPGALFKDVLAGLTDAQPRTQDVVPASAAAPTIVHAMSESAPREADPPEEPQPHMPTDHHSPESQEAADLEGPDRTDRSRDESGEPVPPADGPGDEPAAGDGPVHRRLIRATLPRSEGQKDARPLPEFTVRQSPGRNGGATHFRGERMRGRGGHAAGQGEPNGNRVHGSHGRGHGGRAPGGRPPSGRGGGPGGFRGGHAGPKGGRRGRGSR